MKTKNKDYIIEKIKKLREKGFIKSNRKHNTGIGKTLEDLLGVEENNIDGPDLKGYEVKSHREESGSYTSLFTKAPTRPRGANAYLLKRYGIQNPENPALKKLFTSMFANKKNTYCGKYSFKLENDKESKIIKILIYENDVLIDSSVYYTYEVIENALNKKLKKLLYVSAESKMIDGEEYFKYNKFTFYEKPSLEKFLEMLDKGLIMYDIRMGSYESGEKIGKPHDHGSVFRILEANISSLYAEKEVIE